MKKILYINELLFDVQGSKKKNKQLDYTVSKWVNKLRSNFAKYSLYFNGKVIVSQLSSIPAARKYISFTNLTKAISLIGKKVPEYDVTLTQFTFWKSIAYYLFAKSQMFVGERRWMWWIIPLMIKKGKVD